MFDTVATLYQETVSQDAMLNEVKTYGEGKDVPVRRTRSITRSEFYQAAAQGLKPAAVLTIFFADYEGEKVVVWQGNAYRVTRTYQKPASDDLELTLEESLDLKDFGGGADGD